MSPTLTPSPKHCAGSPPCPSPESFPWSVLGRAPPSRTRMASEEMPHLANKTLVHRPKYPRLSTPKADTGPVSLSPTPGVSHPTMSLMAAEQLFEIQNCVYLRAEMEVHVHSFRCALSRVTYPFRPASAISSAPSPATTANPPSGACSLWRALASLVQEPPHLSPHPGGQRYPRPRQTRRERNSSIRQNVALSFGVALLKTELWRRLPIRIRLGVKST